VNHSLSDTLTPNYINSGFLIAAVWPLDTGTFTDYDFLPSALTGSLLQDNNILGNVEPSDSHTSRSNLGVSCHHSASGLNTGLSSSESNLLSVTLAEMKLFLRQKF
jgi:hypothetical protein